MNPKIQRISSEIEKTRTKITDLQARLRDLEAQKIDMENTEIINQVRAVDIDPAELAGFIRAYKAQGTAGRPVPRAEGSAHED